MNDKDRPLRIAWFGEARDSGGVPQMGVLLLDGLLKKGAQIDWYTAAGDCELPERLRGRGRLAVIRAQSSWQWNKWYSRKPLLTFVSSLIARRRAYARLCEKLLKEHARQHYDVIFQLSQIELFGLGIRLRELPPIVIYPCVHAAGELRWHRRESRYARKFENRFVHYGVRCFLLVRSVIQKYEVKKPSLIIGMSTRFNEIFAQDYGVQPQRQAVLYHPIELAACSRKPQGSGTTRKLKLLFVARISVRKGVEQIIELSKRLDDLYEEIEIDVIGGATLWSDYRRHLVGLNPRTASYRGSLPHEQIMSCYDTADILLLPSHYEPGGIVVGEALSRGVPVVISDEIGSGEPISAFCCRRFRAGDPGAFEEQVRNLIAELRTNPAPLRESAREQARIHFAPDKIASDLERILRGTVHATKAAKVADTRSASATAEPAPMACLVGDAAI